MKLARPQTWGTAQQRGAKVRSADTSLKSYVARLTATVAGGR